MAMTKRERVMNMIQGKPVDRVPTAFWYHFTPSMWYGEQSIYMHNDFFKRSRADFYKVMDEHQFESEVVIKTPSDLKHLKPKKLNSPEVQDQLAILKGVLDANTDGAVVLASIYSVVSELLHAFTSYYRKMWIPGSTYNETQAHAMAVFREDPEAFSAALKVVAECQTELAQACLDVGAGGIFYAMNKIEKHGFTDEEFNKYVRPLDMQVLEVAKQSPDFNVLHLCRDHVAYDRFVDYPGDVFNWSVSAPGNLSMAEGRKKFPNKTIMGGLPQNGVIHNGTREDIRKAVFDILDVMGDDHFILGSDCVLPTDILYQRLVWAVEACEEYAETHKK